ncbi:unnamed protein product [Anisakis simplex]|uniref:Uncharacterized protein n=1 Tax=Anisakis simplex TaxID=6269 RepID=A0A3P6PSW7_ANISI|nr:unnamed protein product [Anisakis simplex]
MKIGSCESSDYCYIERKPTDIQGLYRITKGCIKRPLRTHTGCDYDRFNDHILCVCKGSLLLTSYCASGCGYGPPSLPYFYKGPELLYHRTRLCITMSSDNKKELALHRCVSCEISSSDANIISSCKQNTCIAHFCTYNTRRLHNSNSPFMNERQGCINVTDDYQVRCSSSSKHYDSTTMQMQFGCSHKWMNNEEEELLCACRGDKCNRDLLSASQNNHISIYHHSFVHLLLSLFVITIL